MARKPTDTIYLQLRISEGLRRRLEREANKLKRSMNAEIIHRLDASFEQPMLTVLMENAVMGALIKYHAKPEGPTPPPPPSSRKGILGLLEPEPKSKDADEEPANGEGKS
jgi:hypothetical protein